MIYRILLVVELLLWSSLCTSAFWTTFPQFITKLSSSKSSLDATAVDAVASLSSSQISTVQKIAAAIPDLKAKPDYSWSGADGIIIAGATATLDARTAPGPSNLAWLSALTIDSKMVSLQIFNGPLTDVPHLTSRCVVMSDSTMRLTLDFRPRSYGAYEMRRPDGSYPGPDELGRRAFELSGNRIDFSNKFGNDDLYSFLSSTVATLEGAVAFEGSLTELDKLTRGPLFTCLDMPVTDGNIAAVVVAREKVADIWLSWSQDPAHQHRPGAPVNAQYVYDTKFRQNAYGALLEEYSALFGPDHGKLLAVADSGPLDEAYVGGAS